MTKLLGKQVIYLAVFLFVSAPCFAEENASNPLAKVKYADVRAQYFDNPDGSYIWDFWLALSNDAIPATVEVQLGRMHNENFGYYAEVGAGLGSDRPYDWGIGVGARFNY
jgi:hypothetical protein